MDSSPMSPPAPESVVVPEATSSRSWSIYGRGEITQRYEILGRIGSGAYADVYRARRRSDGLEVALKEVHDYVSSLREIEALQALRGAPNVVELLEFFWAEEEDAVLVLEFLPVDLASVVRDARKAGGGGTPVGETKSWIIQILRGVEACHRSGVVHRDLKPSNLLISATGVLKLADFGQARILQDTQFQWTCHHPENTSILSEPEHHYTQETKLEHEAKHANEDEYLREMESLKAKNTLYDTDKETSLRDGDTSCLATCSTGDVDDDPFKGYYSYEGEEGSVDESSALTSCVGTRWFRAPELLYGSTSYGLEIDLWSLGCIVAELLRLQPLFPGTSDIDQIGRILSVLGDLTEETCPGCSKFPDFNKLFFNKVESPIGLEALFPNRSASEITLVRKLLRYNPADRATATMLLHDSYFSTEPLPVDVNELTVPSTRDDQDESSQGEWADFRDGGSDSDFDGFGNMDVSTTEKGFSIRFS